MQITTTRRAAQQHTQTKAAPATTTEGEQQPPASQDSFQKSFMSSLANPEVSNSLLSQVKNGNSLTINPTEDGGVKITNTGPSLLDKTLSSGGRLLANAGQEVVRVMNADPSFSFLASAKAAREGIEGLVPRNSMGDVDKLMMPALRGVMLLADGKRAVSTFQNKDSSLFEKGVDSLHVVTDVVGMAGELGKVGVLPFMSESLSGSLATVGFIGDFTAVAFHALGYLTERGQVNAEFTGSLSNMNDIWSSSAAKAAEERAAKAKKAEEPK